MRAYLPFIVVGLVTGAVYAIASMGLVHTYTTSGVFNFAHGAVGMFATYVFYSLRVDRGVPTALAVAVAVLLVAPLLGIIIDRVLLRRLATASGTNFMVVSLGLLVALQALALAIYGGDTRQVAPMLPTSTFRIVGVNVGYDQAIMVGIAVAVFLGLQWFFRRTHLGLQTRAVVGDKDLTELVGANSQRVTTFSWMLGCSLAALAGILFAPFIGLDSLLLTLLVVQAFSAAIVGRLRSLALTNLGAYAIGVGSAVCTKLVATHRGLNGLPSALPFIVLVLVLVLSRKGAFSEAISSQATGTTSGNEAIRRGMPVRWLVGMTVAALAVPAFIGDSQILIATSTVAFVLVFTSLSLLVGLSRQLSLCHTVFVVFGATTLAHLLTAGVPYVPALVLSGLIIVPFGALLAIPAIRLSGLFLALATLGFGFLTQNLLFPTGIAFGSDAVALVGRPLGFGGETAFYYFVVAVVLLGVLAAEAVRVTRLGRVLRGLADSPTAMESLGVNPTASRVLVFCLSAFLAAIAGGLLGSLVQLVNAQSFDIFQSLIWLTVLVAAGAQTFGGAVLAAILFKAVPAVFSSNTVAEWQPVFFGVAAILLAQAPNGLVGVRLPKADFEAMARRSAWRTGRRRGTERYVRAALGRSA